MSTKSGLAQRLAIVAGFENPSASLEQYRTPPELAAHLVHTADLQGDVEHRTVVDLGCGTGMLALGAALRGPTRVVGIDVDPAPLATATENERKVASASAVEWLRADATQAPICPDGPTTVVMNPPFGAQAGNEHADRAFLGTAAEIADVSYSIHNENSDEFVEAFAADEGGEVTHAFRATFELPNQFDHHTDESRSIDAEVFRIQWA
ncbi:METTL5 family protein [Halorientalis pallida]|uniref:Methyltransferase domain-containing protein n=1 Tax=Halorientalis pallida TaxID=2479928 RepID=A0A498KS63_9EURY|nr:METTL5 family protein [Halorientalis pallida]RXK46645.1 methyltransferase domain-containing protein [Halorientalis pallida]